MKKMILGLVATMTLTVSAFADLSKDEVRLKIARSTEVKAISEAYKKQGYKCSNTTIESVVDYVTTANKICTRNDADGEFSKIMIIKASVTEEGSTALILNIEFMLAG